MKRVTIGSRSFSKDQQKLSFLIQNRIDICVVHAQYVDRPNQGDSIGGLEGMIDQIHAAGLLAGISTHQVATIELCENRNYGIDTYLFPLKPRQRARQLDALFRR